MSKSLGTGVDPLDLIAEHGADATRYGLLKMSSTQDVRFAEGTIEEGRGLCNKLWNAARLILLNVDPEAAPAPTRAEPVDAWVLGQLADATAEVTAALDAYDFAAAVKALYRFVWNDVCDWYLEAAKARLYGDDAAARRAVSETLLYVLRSTLRLAHPVLPHVTERIWEELGEEGVLARARLARPSRGAARRRRRGGGRAGLRVRRQAARSCAPSPKLAPRAPLALQGWPLAAVDRRCVETLGGVATHRPTARASGARSTCIRSATRPSPCWRPAAPRTPRPRFEQELAKAEGEIERAAPQARRRALRGARARAPRAGGARQAGALRARGGRAARSGSPPSARDRARLSGVARRVRDEARPRAHHGAARRARAIRRSELDAIHVVGTNGKSSTVRFAAAALTASGLRTGAYLSPHVIGWDERVQIDGRPIGPAALAVALDRVQDAARAVERELGEGPTQFEALTAAAFLVLAEAGVEACVVEAGPGRPPRRDARRQRARRRPHERRPRPPARARRHARADPGREARRARARRLARASASSTTSCTRRRPSWPRPPARAASASPPGAGEKLPLPRRPTCATTPRSRCAWRELLLAPRELDRGRATRRAGRGRPARPARADPRQARDPARRGAQRRGHAGARAGARRRPRQAPPAHRRRRAAGRQARRGHAGGARARARRGHRDEQRARAATRGRCRSRRSPMRRARRASGRSWPSRSRSSRSRVRGSGRARGGAVVVTGSLYLLERLRAAALEAR